MKIPKDVVGQKKIRDAKIISLYASDGYTMKEIAERFGISETRVSTIIYRNRALLKLDQQHEKAKRISHLRYLLRKHRNTMAKKSTLDIIDQLRDEVEGKGGSGPQSVGRGDTRVIIIRETTAAESQPPQVTEINRMGERDGDQNTGGTVSRSVSVIRV